jgi:hypothetical protein
VVIFGFAQIYYLFGMACFGGVGGLILRTPLVGSLALFEGSPSNFSKVVHLLHIVHQTIEKICGWPFNSRI